MTIQITMTDGKKVRITLPDGLSDDQIQAEVNEVESQYYAKFPQKIDITDLERKADISSTTINTRDGKVVPANTSSLGADRVHLSDIYAASRPRVVNLGIEGLELLTQPVPTIKVGTPEAKASRTMIQRMYPELSANQGYNAEGTQLLPLGPTLRDIYSMPGRAISTGIEYGQKMANKLLGTNFKADPDLGRTSADSEAEGRSAESILTSPLLTPNLIGAIGTGGATLPAQILSGAGIGVATGASMNPEYGGEDVALDVALSTTPALGPILAKLPIKAGADAILKAMHSVGISDAHAKYLLPLVQKRGYGAAHKLGTKLTAMGRKGIAADISPQEIKTDILTPDLLLKSAGDAPYSLPDRLDVSRVLLDQPMPSRSLHAADEAIAMLPAIKSKISHLNQLLADNSLSKRKYSEYVEALLTEYGDIPEVQQLILSYASKSFNPATIIARPSAFAKRSAGETLTQDDLIYMEPMSGRISDAVDNIAIGTKLSKLYPPTTAPIPGLGLGDISLGGARKLGQWALTQPRPTVAALEAGALETLVPTGSVVAQEYLPEYLRD